MNATLVADLLRSSGTILITSHANPDGDAIGCLLGFGRLAQLLGKDMVLWAPDGVPDFYVYLPLSNETVPQVPEARVFDATFVLDTADPALLGPGFPPAERSGRVCVIDHHLRAVEWGDLIWRDASAAAAGILVYELARELAVEPDESLAECLWASIYTDTGGFRYSSTDARALRVGADLLDWGVDPWQASVAIFESNPPSRVRLLGEVLSTLELWLDGKMASITVTQEMLDRAGLDHSSLDTFINHPRSIRGVEVAVQFSERSGRIKVSFRSKGKVDVSALARRFGGGGHRNAAGCRLDTDMETAKKRIVAAASEIVV